MVRRDLLTGIGAFFAAPAVKAGILDRVLGAAGLGGDIEEFFLDGAIDAGLRALFERTKVEGAFFQGPFGVSLVTPGLTVELRAEEGTFEQARRVEQAFQRVLKADLDKAMQYALEDRALQQLVETGLKAAFAKAGCLEVLTADGIRRWSKQRRDERGNDEVRQGSMPAKGTLERPFLIAEWKWIPLAGVDTEKWWQVVTMQNIVELTSQLSVTILLAESGITVGTFVVPVEVRAVGAKERQKRSTYGRPFIHSMMTLATAHLGGMLAQQVNTWDQVCLGRLQLQAGPQEIPTDDTAVAKLVTPLALLPRYRVFAIFQRHAVLTVGQEEGLVGTNDADGLPVGSSVWVNGYEYRLGRTARRISLVSLDGLSLEAQEAISRPDAAVTWPGMPQPLTSLDGAVVAPAPESAGDSVSGTVTVY